MKLKKMLNIIIAAVMAILSMSISVFAEENDYLIATIPTLDGENIEVYKSDLNGGRYSVECDGIKITVGEKDISPLQRRVLYEDFIDDLCPPPYLTDYVDGSALKYLSFAVNTNNTQSSPKYYAPQLGRNSLSYHFYPSDNYGTKVVGQVHYVDGGNPVQLYLSVAGKDYYVDISNMGVGNLTYATVTNWTYNGIASGTCMVAN